VNTAPPVPVPWRQRRAALVGLRLLGQGLEFLAWVVLARRLPPETFGHLSVVFLACRYGGLVADWGARYSGMRSVAAGLPLAALRPLLRRRERLAAGLGAAFVVAVAASGYVAMLPLAAVLVQQGVNRDWMSLGQGRMVAAGLPALAQGGALLALVCLVPAHGPAAAGALGASYALALAASCLLNRRPRATAASTDAPRLGGWMVTAVLADQALATVDTFLLALLISASDAGMYAAVYRLPNAWLAVVGLVSVSCIPAVAAGLAADPDRVAELRSRMLRRGLAAASLALAGAPVAFFAAPAVFGPDYREASVAAAVLVASSAVTTVTAALLPLYLSVVPDVRYAAAQSSAAALNVVMNLALIPVLGMSGAAVSTLLAQLVLLALVWRGLTAATAPSASPQHRRGGLARHAGSVRRATGRTTAGARQLARPVTTAAPLLLLLALAPVLTGAAAVSGAARAVVGAVAVALAAVAVPVVRAALLRPQTLPFLLAAPAAVAVYPALAVPATTGVLVLALVLLRERRPDVRAALAVVLAAGGLLLSLGAGLAHDASPVHLVGDAVQFAAFYLAALVARTRDVDLLSRWSLWGLWLAVVAVTAANALGRVDFLVVAGSDLRRNINFLAPVLLVWALTHLLWYGVTRAGVLWIGSAGLSVLAGFTRGMWAGAAAGVLAVVLVYVLGWGLPLRRARRLAATAGLALVAASALPVAAPTLTALAVEKAATLVDHGRDYTYQQRSFESEAVLDQLANAATGHGWGATYVVPAGGTIEPGRTHYVHNQYVAHLLRTGWVGCALAALSILLLLRVRRGHPGSAAAAGTLAYVLVTGWTSPSLFTYPTNVLAGLALGAAPLADAAWRRRATARDRALMSPATTPCALAGAVPEDRNASAVCSLVASAHR
jgi:O-antigen/teichoic acid export membrane protein